MAKFFQAKWEQRLEALNAARLPMTEHKFVESMVAKGHTRHLARLLHQKVLSYLPNSSFSIYPSDNVLEDYCIDDEDFADMLEAIFTQEQTALPSLEKQNAFYQQFGAAITVERMVHFISFFCGNGHFTKTTCLTDIR